METKTIMMTDLIKLQITNYFSFKSYVDIVKIEDGEINPSKCYVKIKCVLDYYMHDENYHVIDINFKDKTMNGFINLDKI